MHNVDAHQITVSRYPGFMRLFGLVFASGGFFFLYSLLQDPESVTVNGRPGTVGDAWLPLIFVAVGLGIALIRFTRRLSIDSQDVTSQTIKGWGPFALSRIDEHGKAEEVYLSREVRRSDNSNYTVYPISIKCGDHMVDAGEWRSPGKARNEAEKLAKFANVGVADTRNGDTVRRQADELDTPAVERMDVNTIEAQQPEDSRIHIEDMGSDSLIRIGRSPAMLLPALALIPMALITFGFWWFFWFPGTSDMNTGDKGTVSYFDLFFAYAPLLVGFVLPVLAGLFKLRKAGFFGSGLRVGSDGLRYGGTSLQAQEIEEINLVGGPKWTRHLAIVSDRKEINLAMGHSEADLAYLRAQILKALQH